MHIDGSRGTMSPCSTRLVLTMIYYSHLCKAPELLHWSRSASTSYQCQMVLVYISVILYTARLPSEPFDLVVRYGLHE